MSPAAPRLFPSRCPECGAPEPPNGSCREHFHTLLAREWQIAGGPGEVSHFLAVAAYGLQHPVAMNHTRAAAEGLRGAVSEALRGAATISDLRRRARLGAAKRGRVTRRGDEPEARHNIAAWPLTIVNVIPAMTDRDTYAARVAGWARSVCERLDARPPEVEGGSAGQTAGAAPDESPHR